MCAVAYNVCVYVHTTRRMDLTTVYRFVGADTEVERNALMESAYRDLKEYCKERNLEFQVIVKLVYFVTICRNYLFIF